MLAAATRLFEVQGYSRTTFEEIAAEARVGVATIYKYFASKQGIVSALLEPDLRSLMARAQRIVDGPLDSPGQSMVSLLSAYRDLGGRNWASRELLQLTVFPGIGNEGLLTELVHDAERQAQTQIGTLLRRFKSAGQLRRDLPLNDATAIIFALFNQHFGMYLSDPKMRFEPMFRNLARRIRLVFTEWCPPSAPKRGSRS